MEIEEACRIRTNAVRKRFDKALDKKAQAKCRVEFDRIGKARIRLLQDLERQELERLEAEQRQREEKERQRSRGDLELI